MRLIQKSTLTLLAPAMACSVFLSKPSLAADTASTTVTASIVGGACNIAVPASVPFGEVQAAEITSTNDISKNFDLTLSDCNGYGLTPSISVSGDINSASGNDLFMTTASTTSQGYGVLLSTAGNANFEQNGNLATLTTINAKGTWSLEQASALNGKIPMKAAISCGDCVANTLQGGVLTASITFNFLYQ